MQANSFTDEVGSHRDLPATSEPVRVASAASEPNQWLPMIFDPGSQAPPIPGLAAWLSQAGSLEGGAEPHHHWGINE